MLVAEKEDYIIIVNSLPKNRKSIDEILKHWDSDGVYEKLINRHLKKTTSHFVNFPI